MIFTRLRGSRRRPALALVILPALLGGALIAPVSSALAAEPGPIAHAEAAPAAATGPESLTLQTNGTLGANGWYVNGVTPTVHYSLAPGWGPDDTVTVTLSGATTLTREFRGQATAGLYISTFGITDVSVTARRATGESFTRTTQVKFDPTSPIGQGKNLPTDARVGDTWIVDFECLDWYSGVETCELEGYARGDVIRFDEDGFRRFTVRASDRAGNTGTSQFGVLVKDSRNEPPVLSVERPQAPETGWHRGPVALEIGATPKSSPVHSFEVDVNGTKETLAADARGYEIRGDGRHLVRVWVRDTNGNMAGPEARQVDIDGTPPKLTLSTSIPARVLRDQKVPVRFSCADATSGVASCGGALVSGANLPTTSTGKKQLTLRARDTAGNEVTRVVTYEVVAKAATKAVLSPTKKRLKRGVSIRARVLVTAPGTTFKPSGIVRIMADKKVIAKAKVSNGKRVSVRLPKFTKPGAYKLRAVFTGATGFSASKSKTVKVRVLG